MSKQQIKQSVHDEIEEAESVKQTQSNLWVPWTQLQKLKYSIFVQFFLKYFTNRKRKPFVLYKLMSQLIRTRTASQCRTFSYKMQKSYPSYDEIIQTIKNRYSPQRYEEESEKYRKDITKLTKAVPNLLQSLTESTEDDPSLVFFTIPNSSIKRLGDQKNVLSNRSTGKEGVPSLSNQPQSATDARKQRHCNLVQQYPYSFSSKQLKKTEKRNQIDNPKLEQPEPQLKSKISGQLHQFEPMNCVVGGFPAVQSVDFDPLNKYDNLYLNNIDKQQLINKCQYHWKQWIRHSLQLLEIEKLQYQQNRLKMTLSVQRSEKQIEKQSLCKDFK